MNKTDSICFDTPERVSVFRKGRIIYFYDDVDNHSVAEATQLFQELEGQSKKQPITIIINSCGGSIYDGLALYDRIRISPCKVIMIGTGFVGSMGLIIFLAGDERVITPTTTLLSHQGSMELEGRTEDVKIEAHEMDRLEKITVNLISKATGQTIKQVEKDIEKGDKYISAEEAIKKGFATKILSFKN